MARRPRTPRHEGLGTTSTAITGLDEVKYLLASLLDVAPELYWEILEKYGQKIHDEALTGFENKTGNLRRSFTIKKKKTENTQRVTVSAGGKKAPHAHLVEFGHRQTAVKGGPEVAPYFVSGKKYMRNAFERNIDSLTKELDDALNSFTDI